MTVNNRILKVFMSVTMLLLFSSVSLFSQNLIVNGDFEQTSGFNYNQISDYQRITGGAVESGHFIHDVTSTDHGSGTFGGWPANLKGYGGSGYYLLFNGFGGTQNQNKVVWRQTVNVTNQTTYTFSCQLRNLSQSFFGFNANTAIIRIKINGNTVGQDVTFDISNHNWQGVTRTWNSGNVSGPITIELFDVFNGDPGSGDDFGLDHISFTPNEVYDVNAQDDIVDEILCVGEYVDINVLGNDNVLPNTNDAQIQILTDPIPYGTADILSDKRIRYTFTDANYHGEVQFEYQVTIHGVQSQAFVHINTALPPTVGSISEIIPTSVCAPAVFSCDLPTIVNNGSDLIGQGWQMQIGGQWVDIPDPIEYQHNGCNVRYFAENDCETSYSVPVPLTVNAVPSVGSISAPLGICEGDTLALTLPNGLEWRHDDPSSCWGSWEIQINGVWDSLVNNNIPFDYNGCYIRYKAVNGCGVSYSTNNVQITVYSTASVYEGEITACDVIYHHGMECNSTGLYTTDSITPNDCQIQVSWSFTLGEVNIMPVETIERCDSYYWPRTGQNYYASTIVYDTVYSTDPQMCDSIFTLDLTINHAPTIQGDIHTHDICVGDLLEIEEPEYEYNHIGGGRHQWEFATSLDGPFQSFDPETYHFELGSYYILFTVVNGCDSVSSNVLQVHVNDQPVISGQLSSFQVCEGDLLDLPEVSVEWQNASQNGVTEWQMAESQDGPYALFDSMMPMLTEHDDHWVRFMACNECDTVYLGPVHITVLFEQDVTVEHDPVCDSVLFNGVYYTESAIIDEVVEEPCPHTIHHEITVNHSDYKLVERTSCHEYFDWHGYHFEHSDETQYATFDTVNAYGCDSIVELRLNFDSYEKINLDDVLACDSYVWEMNPGHVYYESQRDSVLIPASGPDDCPTWYCLNMFIGTSFYDVEGDPMTECRGFEWHGVPYYENTIVIDSLQTKITHCDSIVYYQLTIVQPFDTIVEMVSCNPVVWHGHPFVGDEIYTDTLESVVTGCDSIVTINFRLDDIVNRFDTVACEPFEWYGYDCGYSSTGTMIQHVFETAAGCDSTVIKYVYIYPPEESIDSVYACDSYLCPFNGILYDDPGVYYIGKDTAFNQYGCDSIVYRLRLEIKDSEQIGLITGPSNVFVASSLISGIYRYEINLDDVQNDIIWNLSNPDWQVVEAQQNYCLVFVTTPGTATLSVSFLTSDCGEMERSFEINAGFFGVSDHDGVVANIYPNPTKGTVTVEAEGIESIRLTDMMGQILDWREYDRSNTATLYLGGFLSSVYLLEVKTVNGMVKKRVVVSR